MLQYVRGCGGVRGEGSRGGSEVVPPSSTASRPLCECLLKVFQVRTSSTFSIYELPDDLLFIFLIYRYMFNKVCFMVVN